MLFRHDVCRSRSGIARDGHRRFERGHAGEADGARLLRPDPRLSGRGRERRPGAARGARAQPLRHPARIGAAGRRDGRSMCARRLPSWPANRRRTCCAAGSAFRAPRPRSPGPRPGSRSSQRRARDEHGRRRILPAGGARPARRRAVPPRDRSRRRRTRTPRPPARPGGARPPARGGDPAPPGGRDGAARSPVRGRVHPDLRRHPGTGSGRGFADRSRCSTGRPTRRRANSIPMPIPTSRCSSRSAGAAIDIGEAVAQELSLALPEFPRHPDAAAEPVDAAAEPIDDRFAALARLGKTARE